jgi:hypothetical protein
MEAKNRMKEQQERDDAAKNSETVFDRIPAADRFASNGQTIHRELNGKKYWNGRGARCAFRLRWASERRRCMLGMGMAGR